jgi:hypothetical protein
VAAQLLLFSHGATFVSLGERIVTDERGFFTTARDTRTDLFHSKTSQAAPPHPKRAVWLEAELALRAWSVHDLQAQGGPDWKTSRKILNGLSVSRTTLEKTVAALSKKRQKVRFGDIPPDS